MIFGNKNSKLSIVTRNLLMYLVIILFSVFSVTPVKFFSFLSILPNIGSILLFYFLIIKKDDVSYFAIFILGLFFDIFNSLPLGTTSLTWLISSKFISFLRTHLYTPDNFIAIFRDFSIFAFSNSLIHWMIMSITFRTPYPISNSIVQFILNIMFFAILYRPIRKAEKWII